MPRYIIVGCGPAGSAAAEAIRQADAGVEILLLSHEGVQALARPRLVEYAAGAIDLKELETKDGQWAGQFNLQVRLSTVVEGVDASARQLRLAGGETLAYDKLLAATGIGPRAIPFEGADLAGVFNMHHQPEADRVRAAVSRAEQVIVVGGGFLGQDMTKALAAAGRRVTLLVREDRVGVPQFDPGTSAILLEELRALGADVRLQTELARIGGAGGQVVRAVTNRGDALPCQVVFVAIGAQPNAAWLKDSGVEVARGLVTDGRLATRVPGIFAAGSVAEVRVNNRVLLQASWVNATAQGRAAGVNLAGGEETYFAPSEYTAKVGRRLFSVYGPPAMAFPEARYVGFRAADGGYGCLVAEGGLVRGAILVGRHPKAKEIKTLQFRDAPLPGLAELQGEQNLSIDEFVARALGPAAS